VAGYLKSFTINDNNWSCFNELFRRLKLTRFDYSGDGKCHKNSDCISVIVTV